MKALFFDCDGVLADTERHGHLPAFNKTFEHFGVPVVWSDEDYAELVKIGGGKERMASLFSDKGLVARANLPTDEAAQKETLLEWHRYKTATYKQMVRDGVMPARPGIARIVDEAIEAGWILAVASTSAEESVRAVLEHAVGAEKAAKFTVLGGDVVPAKKPDPAIYELAIEKTGADKAETIVVEDSRNGLRAAVGAGLKCLVTVSSYTAEEDMSEAIIVVSSLGDDGEPTEVIENRSDARPGEVVKLEDLEACIATV